MFGLVEIVNVPASGSINGGYMTSLGTTSNAFIAALIVLLGSSKISDRLWAVQLAAATDSPGGRQLLDKATADPDSEVRGAASAVLAEIQHAAESKASEQRLASKLVKSKPNPSPEPISKAKRRQAKPNAKAPSSVRKEPIIIPCKNKGNGMGGRKSRSGSEDGPSVRLGIHGRLVIRSKRGTRLDGLHVCARCSIETRASWVYGDTTWGRVVLCSECKNLVHRVTDGSADAWSATVQRDPKFYR